MVSILSQSRKTRNAFKMEFPKLQSEFNYWAEAKNKEVSVFRQRRSSLYKNVVDQLDDLWKDIEDGIIPGKGGKFHQSISRVKNAVKKPEWYDEYLNFDFSKEEFEDDIPLITLKRDDASILQYIKEAEKFLQHGDEVISKHALKLTKNAHDLISNLVPFPTFVANVPKLNYLMYTEDVNTLNYIHDQIVTIYHRPPK